MALLSCLGIAVIGVVIHEGVHVFQATNPHKLCFNIGAGNMAETYGDGFKAHTETWANIIEYLFVMITLVFIINMWIKEWRK